MITQMSMKNFKSWASTGDIPLAPLTGFFGTNSSGKSSLLQMLLLLKQTVASADRKIVLLSDGDYVNLGTIPEMIHNGGETLNFEIAWNLPDPISIPNGNGTNSKRKIDHLAFQTEIVSQDNKNYVESLRYSSYGLSAEMLYDHNRKTFREQYTLLARINDVQIEPVSHRLHKVTSPIKCYGFPEDVFRNYQSSDYMSDLVLAFEQLFRNIFYLGPLREFPQRTYSWAGDEPDDMGRRGEKAIAALLAKREQPAYKGKGNRKKLEQRIAEWLVEMGMASSFRTNAISKTLYEVLLKRHSESVEVPITEMGFGVSQLLPVLVLCYYCPEGSTIIFEQPEIHLHPAVQSILADVFVDVITKRKVQIIFESHSEHLLRRLQRRIAEEKLKQEETALYFCDIEQGVSQLSALNVDPFGNIRNWPQDFFGDLTGDMFETAQAGIKRQFKIQKQSKIS